MGGFMASGNSIQPVRYFSALPEFVSRVISSKTGVFALIFFACVSVGLGLAYALRGRVTVGAPLKVTVGAPLKEEEKKAKEVVQDIPTTPPAPSRLKIIAQYDVKWGHTLYCNGIAMKSDGTTTGWMLEMEEVFYKSIGFSIDNTKALSIDSVEYAMTSVPEKASPETPEKNS
jgi:hypothetical protein